MKTFDWLYYQNRLELETMIVPPIKNIHSQYSYSYFIEKITAIKVFYIHFDEKLRWFFLELKRRVININEFKKAKQKLMVTKDKISQERKKSILKILIACARNKSKVQFNKWRNQVFLKKMFFKTHLESEKDVPQHIIEK